MTTEYEESEDDDDEDKPDLLSEAKEPADLEPVTAAQLLTSRNETLLLKQQEIGSLSSSVLENPDETLGNLHALLNMMDEHIPELFLTVKKLVMVSLLEIFKDILPSYQIKHEEGGNQVKRKVRRVVGLEVSTSN